MGRRNVTKKLWRGINLHLWWALLIRVLPFLILILHWFNEILTYIVSKGPLLWQMHGHGVSTTAPASHGHSAVTYKNCLYIYGGDVKDNKRISDVHKHSLGKKTEQKK